MIQYNSSPFYRTAQFIVTPRDQRSIQREDPKNFDRVIEYGPVFKKSFLEGTLKLYDKVLSLTATSEESGRAVGLRDICYKPLYPDNNNCAVLSIFNYFQVIYYCYSRTVPTCVFKE